jgi:hypothetical protein
VYIVSTVDNSKKMIGEPYLHVSKTKEVEKSRFSKTIKTQKKEMNISTEKKIPWK